MNKTLFCFGIAALIATSYLSYEQGYNTENKDAAVNELSEAVGQAIDTLNSQKEVYDFVIEHSNNVIADMSLMDEFLVENELIIELDDLGVLVVTLNDNTVSADGVLDRNLFNQNIKGSRLASNGKEFFEMVIAPIYTSVALSEGGIDKAVPGLKASVK
jgi:hypothetical protein